MPTLWLFDIESHEQRYTSEWQSELPRQIQNAMTKRLAKPWNLRIVSGGQTSGSTSPGAFMNFAETNIYKSTQISNFAGFVECGQVQNGDRILFADAWHPGVIQCRYMADLLPVEVTIDVMWHAGSYDPHDFLGRSNAIRRWSLHFERAIFAAASRNYFATQFHKRMFLKRVRPTSRKSARVVGWPMEYLPSLLAPHRQEPKSNIILFPHRLAPEKQPHINKVMRRLLPDFDILEAQQLPLSKSDYRKLVGSASAVISYSRQETLGIGIYEGLLCGAVPIVPGRLSYKELYPKSYYPTRWTNSQNLVGSSAADLAAYVRTAITNKNPQTLVKLANKVGKQYFNGSALYAQVLR